jgi:protein phosphatase
LILKLPEFSLVLLIGPSGAGKSTFAQRHFRPTEIVSSDHCRALVCDDEGAQAVSADAFEILRLIVEKRLQAGRLAVIDATNARPDARKPFIALARHYHCPAVAIVLDMPERLCRERNAARPRVVADAVIREQRGHLHRCLHGLEKEGFHRVYIFRSPEDMESLNLIRRPHPSNRKEETGPLDLVGDVHGCFDELYELLILLGYRISRLGEEYEVYHPDGRKLAFLGDLVDRGPATPEVLRLAMDAVASGDAYCVAGNHDAKLVKALRGRPVSLSHGLAESMRQLEGESAAFRAKAEEFLDRLSCHYVFDEGRLVAVHAGLKESMHGRGSGRIRAFALYGETTGEIDAMGLPARGDWAADYRGKALVVHGHTPMPEPRWLNNTLCIDTGCVFGGKLTALRYPEKELVAVAARRQYFARYRKETPPA